MRRKEIANYPGYFIYENGYVEFPAIPNSRWRARCTCGVKKANGYLGVTFGQPRVQFYVHRLVAEAFLVKPTEKHIVNHKDGNKANNSLDNLEWVTYTENLQHAIDNIWTTESREKIRQSSRGQKGLSKSNGGGGPRKPVTVEFQGRVYHFTKTSEADRYFSEITKTKTPIRDLVRIGKSRYGITIIGK